MTADQGYFEHWANNIVWKITPSEHEVIKKIHDIVSQESIKGEIHIVGSEKKSTAIKDSDIDILIKTKNPVTKAQRKQLSQRLSESFSNNKVVTRSHVIRIEIGGKRKIDLAFENAEFGGRSYPDLVAFKEQPKRYHAVRALKYWFKHNPLPHVGGWALEAIVLHLDNRRINHGLELFETVINWFIEKATPEAILSALKSKAQPTWQEQWTKKLPGNLEAIKNQAKALKKRRPSSFQTTKEVEQWLSGS